MAKIKHEPLFHLTKRTDISAKKAWAIRIAAFVLAILLSAVVTSILSGKDFSFFFKHFFTGAFGTERNIWNLLHEAAILLMIALAVTPCFKMRFWNIGGEGQILMGCLGSAVIIQFMGGTSSNGLTIFVSLILAVAFGIVWAVIPALFKAKWNTNETLLTLMMNYIATYVVAYFIKAVALKGSGILVFNDGTIDGLFGNEFLLKILVCLVVTTIMAIYLKYTKQGYEIAVVGESENTARYIGINTKKVIIRTLIICGAICGIIGFLLVSATNHGLESTAVKGRGFTGVLISWLGHFNPLAMALCSFIYALATRGAVQVGTVARLGDSYPNIIVAILFLCILATEFFINYNLVFKYSYKIKAFFAPLTDKLAKINLKLPTKKAKVVVKEEKEGE